MKLLLLSKIKIGVQSAVKIPIAIEKSPDVKLSKAA